MPYFDNALQLIIKAAFDALTLLFLLRVFAELWRADFNNQLSQFIYRYTNPVVIHVRRWVANWQRWNLAALLIAFVLQILRWLFLFATAQSMPHLGGLLLLSFGSLLSFAAMTAIVLVFVWALASMFAGRPGHGTHPVMHFINQLVEPAMRPLSQRIPSLGGIDFSPTVAIIVLLVARAVIAQPLVSAGWHMALG